MPNNPAADTSAFSSPAPAGPPSMAQGMADANIGGSFVEEIAEQIFEHLSQTNPNVGSGEDMDAAVDAFLAQLREQLVTG